MTEIHNNSLKENVYDFLKQSILTCEMLPGQTISEKDVMEQLSVGRTPVREALLILQNEQLVEMFPRKGTIVKPITSKSVLELFSLRKIIEPAVAVQFLHQIDLLTLLEHDKKLKTVCTNNARKSILDFYKTDIAFHEYLISCSANEKLISVCQPLFLEGLRIGMYGVKTHTNRSCEETYTQHHQIVQAILAEDAQAIRNTFIEHLNEAQISALASLT